jgi:hypothetical protein
VLVSEHAGVVHCTSSSLNVGRPACSLVTTLTECYN